jgi:hypothetical protein
MLMMLPEPWRSMTRPKRWQQRKVPVRLISCTWRHCSSVNSSEGATMGMPALLTRTSTRPKRSSVASTNASTSSARATSARRASTSAPKAPISA